MRLSTIYWDLWIVSIFVEANDWSPDNALGDWEYDVLGLIIVRSVEVSSLDDPDGWLIWMDLPSPLFDSVDSGALSQSSSTYSQVVLSQKLQQ